MRIRSSLPEESLYSEARRRGPGRRPATRWAGGWSSGSPTRRLLRLLVLLVLVLLLMREAADPQVYRNFFAALGTPLDPPPAARLTAGAAAPQLDDGSGGAAEDSQVEDPTSKDPMAADPMAADPMAQDARPGEVAWSSLVRRLDPRVLETLAGWLSQWRRGRETEDRGRESEDRGREAEDQRQPLSLPAALEPNLASAAVSSGAIDPERLSRYLRSPDQHAAAIRGLQAAVDRALLRTVSDATIWSAGDRLAFYRLLEAGQGGGFASFGDQLTRVGYTTLADQAAVYRGKPVWLEGQVARVESHQAVENPFGVASYYLVWLRPDDGSQRPVMAYAAEVPEAVSRLRGERLVDDGPSVRAVGVFLRRHLYRSQRGSELAPVIVGRIELLEPAVANRLPPVDPGPASFSLGWMIALTAAVGIGLTLLVTWYTSRAARFSREMRQRGISPTFEAPSDTDFRNHNDAAQ